MPSTYLPNLEHTPEHLPKHVRIAQAIAADISAGHLQAAEKLPGSRQLAHRLGVHRNTVNAALRELVGQGWLDAVPARGCFVRPRGPSRASLTSEGVRGAPGPGFDLRSLNPDAPAAPDPVELALSAGVPDPRCFPVGALSRAYRRVLTQQAGALLSYGEAEGHPQLRRALVKMLREQRGIPLGEDQLMVTRGSQHALWLVAHALLRPGDRVGVEELSYPPAWAALRSAGATLVPLPVDGEGLDVDGLQRELSRQPLRALYLTPQHQLPTTVALSPARRMALMALSARERIAVLEDDYAHEFQYSGRPRLPLASHDPSQQVIYVGSLSKILAPGLRVGYAVGPSALIRRMAQLREVTDRQGDHVAEAVVASLLESGELQRHVRRMRRIYEQRRDHLVARLQRDLAQQVTVVPPQGGMALWARVHDLQASTFCARCRAQGIQLRPGRAFSLAGQEIPYIHMGFTSLTCDELDQAVELVARLAHG